jgi:hypothetical protein
VLAEEAGLEVVCAAVDSPLETLHGLPSLTTNFAARRPLLLALDDLRWSDLPSVRWLAYLLPRIEGPESWWWWRLGGRTQTGPGASGPNHPDPSGGRDAAGPAQRGGGRQTV